MFGISWLDPTTLIGWFGPFAVLGVCLLVFAETGLLIGFFLPGDSLLFITGLFTATGLSGGPAPITMPMWLVAFCVFIAAFIGDQVGFILGRKTGPKIFARPQSRLFNPANVERAQRFFDKYGGAAVFLGRFIPIVRTFVPVTAGVARMHYRHFVAYNVFGAAIWGAGVVVAGHYLGQVVFIREHIDVLLILVVIVSVVPIAITLLAKRRRPKSAASQPDPAASPSVSSSASGTDTGTGSASASDTGSDTASDTASAEREDAEDRAR